MLIDLIQADDKSTKLGIQITIWLEHANLLL